MNFPRQLRTKPEDTVFPMKFVRSYQRIMGRLINAQKCPVNQLLFIHQEKWMKVEDSWSNSSLH